MTTKIETTKTKKIFVNLIGQKFGKLTVIGRESNNKNGSSVWLCKCECGNSKIIQISNLKKQKSCGCILKEINKNNKYGTIHGMYKSREYKSWSSMIHRCNNPNSIDYSYYGGRGIKVCSRWINSFENFFVDMGERPEKTSLDRIDNNGNYEPGNCKWSTLKEQRNNQRPRGKYKKRILNDITRKSNSVEFSL